MTGGREKVIMSNSQEELRSSDGQKPVSKSVRLRTINYIFAVLALFIAAALIITNVMLHKVAHETVVSHEAVNRIIVMQNTLLVLLILAVLGEVLFMTMRVGVPLSRLVDTMHRQQTAEPDGAAELQFVTRTYNEILEENMIARQRLSYEATHDPLTGLFNRSGYDMFMENADREHIALLIIDVDNFKTINDTYGHDEGDRILKKVAEVLLQSFRSVDCVCRLGGDEFVVVMTRADSSMSRLVMDKIAAANSILLHPEDGLPETSLSVGVAFSDRKDPAGNIFKDADTALYKVKQQGRCGCVVYGYSE